ncbi:UDP-N-acetylglucosamine 2-epimerase (non-hydrolyzing) [Parachlamydia sp. AcF125]|uniref:non-hydrolyzing UDP-N-acetylglucosamine 2-epimerase n=1 Tax=Parachlamydia sp. AcF125 TaxID=2795736 RepID=UPI001BCA2DF3|nr:UDP-N-acetylglucosamine 2-epimerase (non-hydrolyzing) [Parachlamydia sp. AcF125]MBS4167782.1 UDP-2,3-diacetamido-2,3-dideoxy-D-glucuronate 2-epimerase [Parachlamydia sp. AcF125]
MKIATIIGARPQFIKAAALSRAISESPSIQEIIIHTGQHYDYNMSDVFFAEMGIPTPNYNLAIGGCSQGAMTGRMLEKIEAILSQERPDWVLVFGDTNSTLAGALASVKLHIPVAHVEAGLRSFNRKMPEEMNRLLTDHCSDLLFTPTAYATQQLKREGFSEDKIIQTGDVMYDTAIYYLNKSNQTSQILHRLSLRSKQFVLATIHRAENTDDPRRLKEIFLGLSAIGRHTPVIVPLHPRTQQMLQKLNLLEQVKQNIRLIEPIGYLDMTQLENHAKLIFTDSGGVQKEAYFFKVPCLTLREETEWVELIEHGFNRLVPLQAKAIEEHYYQHEDMHPDWNISLYGNGEAAKAIVSFLR